MVFFLALLMAVTIKPSTDGTVYKQPQLAAGPGIVGMTFAAGKTVYFASSTDGGRTFGEPVKVAEGQLVPVGRHRGPRVAVTNHAIVISAVAGGDLVAWRSEDRGKTWVRGGTVNDHANAAREGLHAMTAGPDGKIYAVWLDLRAKGTRLYGSRSDDGGRTWSKNSEVYASPSGTICECCHPSLSVDDQGTVRAMWRNSLHGSRDLYMAVSKDGLKFEPAVKLGEGTWKLLACPMDGGGLTARGGHVYSAWRRDGEVFLDEPGKPEQNLGKGKDPSIAAGKSGVWVGWTQGTGLQIRKDSGSLETLAANGAFLNLTSLPDGGVVAAWEAGGAIVTKRLE